MLCCLRWKHMSIWNAMIRLHLENTTITLKIVCLSKPTWDAKFCYQSKHCLGPIHGHSTSTIYCVLGRCALGLPFIFFQPVYTRPLGRMIQDSHNFFDISSDVSLNLTIVLSIIFLLLLHSYIYKANMYFFKDFTLKFSYARSCFS